MEAATVDHRLRPEGAAEARAVAGLCEALGVPHRTLRATVAPGNLQAEARAARYAALARWLAERRLEGLATAHHAQDQAETLLMRLNRGSGLAGLAAIRAVTTVPGSPRRLVRPLLTWRKRELEALVAQAGITACRDASNHDRSFDRVRMREFVADADWLDPVAFARSARWLAQADATLDTLAREELGECGEPGAEFVYFPYRRRPDGVAVVPLWLHIVQEIASQFGRHLGSAQAATMIEHLRRGDKANAGGLAGRPELREGEAAWVFAPENPRRTR